MVVAAGIPKKLTSLSTLLFQMYGNDKFNLETVVDSVISEYKRSRLGAGGKNRPQQQQPQAAKASGSQPQRKTEDPNWKKQAAAPADKSASSSADKKKKTRRGQKSKAKRASEDTEVSDHESLFSDAEVHMVAPAVVLARRQPPLPLPRRLTTPPLLARIMDPRPEAGPSRFTGIQPGPSAWAKNDEVRDLASRIGAVPTTGTLKMLDSIIPEARTTDPRRRAPAYVPPYKRARLAEPVTDQDLDLDLVQVIWDFGEASWGGERMGPGDPDLDLD
ncbi:hypothetical protein H0H81_003341, partial [Sphagnurus paluster]